MDNVKHDYKTISFNSNKYNIINITHDHNIFKCFDKYHRFKIHIEYADDVFNKLMTNSIISKNKTYIFKFKLCTNIAKWKCKHNIYVNNFKPYMTDYIKFDNDIHIIFCGIYALDNNGNLITLKFTDDLNAVLHIEIMI